MTIFANSQQKPMPPSTAPQEILQEYLKEEVQKDQSTEKLFQLVSYKTHLCQIQKLTNVSSILNRNGFKFYSLNLRVPIKF